MTGLLAIEASRHIEQAETGHGNSPRLHAVRVVDPSPEHLEPSADAQDERPQRVMGKGHDSIRVTLKYDKDKVNAITGLQRVSKPGFRKYVGAEKITPTMNGLGIAILTTSRGVMSDRTAREKGVGGELICRVW